MRRKTTHLHHFIIVALLFFVIYNIGGGTLHSRTHSVQEDGEQVGTPPLVKPKAKGLKKYVNKVKKCPKYMDYASVPHFREERGETPLNLPYQRPPENCRTFKSSIIDDFLEAFLVRIKNPDLARLFENTFPNTLDTTILWHVTAEQNKKLHNHKLKHISYRNEKPETFVVTGDIHAEWLRDSAWQLSTYQPFIRYDSKLLELMKGAINLQAQFLFHNPYCNAFHPPAYTHVHRGDSAVDDVSPRPDWRQVFECKYEIDSLASFLTLSRQFYENAPETEKFTFIDDDWLVAVGRLITVLFRESVPTYDENGVVNPFYYKFQRHTNIASETQPLAGTGNPVNGGIGLIRSAFRPSDDSTVFQYFIPGNAHMCVELEHLANILKHYHSKIVLEEEISEDGKQDHTALLELIDKASSFSTAIREGILEHAIFEHPRYGLVFAYEIDGYGSSLFMDDANIPSLLSLPDLGFINAHDQVYQNTRKMIMSKDGNPYYIQGSHFQGIGGPHIGIHNAWPMSLMVAIRTTDRDKDIEDYLQRILESTGGLGLIHESIQAFTPNGMLFTRPWFAWANSEFAKTILKLAEQKPHLIFKEEYLNNKFTLDKFLSSLLEKTKRGENIMDD
ncbi:LAFE_0C12112g1_1 [Lachancea fermentati]|uniref:LAFE_0C12112g1_1 n=1 Tax=Lachancea fermentati TaxID=4955 RepID=A0A1G4MA88_LACFM|nr:LAFE_0C12112g1_1 [Lachancea fermentati]